MVETKGAIALALVMLLPACAENRPEAAAWDWKRHYRVEYQCLLGKTVTVKRTCQKISPEHLYS